MSEKYVRRGTVVAFESWWLAILTEDSLSKFTCLVRRTWSEEDWAKALRQPPTWWNHPEENFRYSFIPSELL